MLSRAAVLRAWFIMVSWLSAPPSELKEDLVPGEWMSAFSGGYWVTLSSVPASWAIYGFSVTFHVWGKNVKGVMWQWEPVVVPSPSSCGCLENRWTDFFTPRGIPVKGWNQLGASCQEGTNVEEVGSLSIVVCYLDGFFLLALLGRSTLSLLFQSMFLL